MNFPLEIVTLLGSGILSGVMSLWGMHIKAKKDEALLTLQALSGKTEAFKVAREFKDKGFQFTRRIIALSAILSIIVLPKVVAAFWPEVPVSVGYTEFHPGFWFLVDGAEAIKWTTLRGLVITPLDTHLVSAITGLYFGASITKNA